MDLSIFQQLKEVDGFEKRLTFLLNRHSLTDLRTFGRELGLTTPTKMKKSELLQAIIGTLFGEIQQKRSNRGAPVKQCSYEKKIEQELATLQLEYTPQAQTEKCPSTFKTQNACFLRLTNEQKDLLHQLIDSF